MGISKNSKSDSFHVELDQTYRLTIHSAFRSGLLHYLLLAHNSVSINVQQVATIHSLSVNCSTCFGWSLHPSAGAQITVSTASGTSQPLLLPVAIVEELRLLYTVYFNCKLLYIFRVVSPPIIRSTNNCTYTIWYQSTAAATCRWLQFQLLHDSYR